MPEKQKKLKCIYMKSKITKSSFVLAQNVFCLVFSYIFKCVKQICKCHKFYVLVIIYNICADNTCI